MQLLLNRQLVLNRLGVQVFHTSISSLFLRHSPEHFPEGNLVYDMVISYYLSSVLFCCLIVRCVVMWFNGHALTDVYV